MSIIQFLIITAIYPLILFLIFGDWGWKQAWVIYALHLKIFYSGRLIAWKRNQALLTEWGRHAEHNDTMLGDQKLVTLSVG